MHPEHPSTEADDYEQIKAAILDQWQRLPVPEQAALLTEQLKIVMEGEAGAALREVLQNDEAESDPFNQVFPVIGFSRADLKRLHFRKREIEQLEDRDMTEIAARLEEAYEDTGFWDHLIDISRLVFENKRRLSTRK